MAIKLYHYIHCPFCLRVRMALGLLGIDYTSVPLSYADEVTPVKLCGAKMLPIVEFGEGDYVNESLDIIARLEEFSDRSGILKLNLLEEEAGISTLKLLDDLSGPLHRLVMPHFIWSKEFDQESRDYFQNKKEKSRGSFNDLVQQRDIYTKELSPYLEEIASNVVDGEGYYLSGEVGILDILLASHLWGLYIVPEFQFSPQLHSYLQRIKKQCHFDYHGELWKPGLADSHHGNIA